MKKNLFRLLTVFVCVFAAWSPLTVQAQPPIDATGIGPVIAEAKIDDHVPSFAEAKQRDGALDE